MVPIPAPADELDALSLLNVLMAFRKGDFTVRMPADRTGLGGKIADTLNDILDFERALLAEYRRVALAVGKEGRTSQRIVLTGATGGWARKAACMNELVGDLVQPMSEVARVLGAVAQGDLTQRVAVGATRPLKGEFLRTARVVNGMVDQLRDFAAEVTRVAREVGTDGKLGGQARVRGVAGTWQALTDHVNSMASNLTSQVRNIAEVTTAVANGDLSKKITVDVRGEFLELKDTVNTMVEQLRGFASEVTRVAREVGTEGRLGGQAVVLGVGGTWKDLTDSVNSMAFNLTAQVRNIAEVTTAVAMGNLGKKITVDAKGEILDLKNTINTMVDQLGSFASEVTRVAREVGTEGKLGGQADVKGVAGVWAGLTNNVNRMASNLTSQVRSIAEVTTAVANGNLGRQISVDVKGEILQLKDTINTMVGQLGSFASEVTRVAREVGTEGRLGGQAVVTGVAGIWKDLTDNVNQLAGNLTTQVRAIAEVATAVTAGNLSRSITVQAAGEVAALKDNINEMIRNLRETTNRNTEQDWLKTNLAKFTRMLQGQRDLLSVADQILSEVAPLVAAQHGVFYLADGEGDGTVFRRTGSYGVRRHGWRRDEVALGEGLVGQAARSRQRILVADVPGDYLQVESGLGAAAPLHLVVLPVMFEGQVNGVLELASLNRFAAVHLAFLDQLSESIGIVLNSISATMRKEELLKQSQALALELTSQQAELTETNQRLKAQASTLQQSQSQLRRQQEELQHANEELAQRARLLAGQKAEVEAARAALQDKAEQLALTSRFKSEFLANMSHELRTPLNSLLLLSRILEENAGGNLGAREVEYAATIHAAGNDLLELINDVLDLAKIESGTMALDLVDVPFREVLQFAERTFLPVAEGKGLAFPGHLDPALPRTLRTDPRRLQQVIRNLLSNAFKFTEAGSVELCIGPALAGWSRDNEVLNRAPGVVAFTVRDTGIGIDPAKHRTIFEAFQQADGTTSRKYGGTGLGLSISREIARMFGGEISLASVPGRGSAFTLFLPLAPPDGLDRPAAKDRPEAIPERRVPASGPLRPPLDAPVPYLDDDQEQAAAEDRVLLAVEDDPDFAKILVDLGRQEGFKVVVAASGDRAMQLARRFRPCAVTLDLGLAAPGPDGWGVLDRLKHDAALCHLPVHIISIGDDQRRGLRMGARSFLRKPASKGALERTLKEIHAYAGRTRRLVLAAAGPDPAGPLQALLGGGNLDLPVAPTGAAALAELQAAPADCLVLAPRLPDLPGCGLLDRIREAFPDAPPPAVVVLERPPTREEEAALARYAEAGAVRVAAGPERLLAAVLTFLHRHPEELPAETRRSLEAAFRQDPLLAGRTVLVVDDDIRNIFALTAVLERHGVAAVPAGSGREALEHLDGAANPSPDLIFMDLMLPEMDGYQIMGAIRSRADCRDLPIIALTAKAMAGDREKSLAAGATDYITKPVDPEQIMSLIRLHLEGRERPWRR